MSAETQGLRVGVVGGGGREHALVAALARSPRVGRLFALPGNPGTAPLAEGTIGVPPDDPAAVAAWARDTRLDLTVIGPEAPLVAGVADKLAAHGLRVFGPAGASARIEGSKAFAKDVMAAAGVPTARAQVFDDPAAALAALDDFGPPWVVKADGLAAGKGVTVTTDRADAAAAVTAALVDGAHGAAGRRVLLEDYLDGPEASLFALSDGHTVVPLTPARDYKRIGAGDTGPNTGGVGAYAPLPDVPPELVARVSRDVLQPVVREMARRGTLYQGLLYAGLALTAAGPRVVEFNCRFGDPEAQVLLPLLRTDLAELLLAACDGQLDTVTPEWAPGACVTVVVASGGYPGAYRTGLPIRGLDDAEAVEGVEVYHAGTAAGADGQLVTAGGRVLAVSAVGDDLAAARGRAYDAAARIRFDGAYVRPDIAEAGIPEQA